MNFLHEIYYTNNVEWITRKNIKFIDIYIKKYVMKFNCQKLQTKLLK